MRICAHIIRTLPKRRRHVKTSAGRRGGSRNPALDRSPPNPSPTRRADPRSRPGRERATGDSTRGCRTSAQPQETAVPIPGGSPRGLGEPIRSEVGPIGGRTTQLPIVIRPTRNVPLTPTGYGGRDVKQHGDVGAALELAEVTVGPSGLPADGSVRPTGWSEARSESAGPNEWSGRCGRQSGGQLPPVLLRGRLPRRRGVRAPGRIPGHDRSDSDLDPLPRPRNRSPGRGYSLGLCRAGRSPAGTPRRRIAGALHQPSGTLRPPASGPPIPGPLEPPARRPTGSRRTGTPESSDATSVCRAGTSAAGGGPAHGPGRWSDGSTGLSGGVLFPARGTGPDRRRPARSSSVGPPKPLGTFERVQHAGRGTAPTPPDRGSRQPARESSGGIRAGSTPDGARRVRPPPPVRRLPLRAFVIGIPRPVPGVPRTALRRLPRVVEGRRDSERLSDVLPREPIRSRERRASPAPGALSGSPGPGAPRSWLRTRRLPWVGPIAPIRRGPVDLGQGSGREAVRWSNRVLAGERVGAGERLPLARLPSRP
jgi:hypothetical protein